MTLKEKLAESEVRAQMFKNALERYIEQRKEQLSNPNCLPLGTTLMKKRCHER